MVALVVASAAGLLLMLSASVAEAHALVRSSNPANGAELQQAPKQVLVTFTEPPDPSLSDLHVLDSNGKDVETGATQAVAGDKRQVRIPLGPVPDGVYTVT